MVASVFVCISLIEDRIHLRVVSSSLTSSKDRAVETTSLTQEDTSPGVTFLSCK